MLLLGQVDVQDVQDVQDESVTRWLQTAKQGIWGAWEEVAVGLRNRASGAEGGPSPRGACGMPRFRRSHLLAILPHRQEMRQNLRVVPNSGQPAGTIRRAATDAAAEAQSARLAIQEIGRQTVRRIGPIRGHRIE